MLAQLKTVVLIKEAIKLFFFKLLEYLEHQHLWVWLPAQNSQKQRPFYWNLSFYSCSEKWWLRDAGLLGRVAKKKPYLRLANKKKRWRWAEEQTLDRGTLPRRPASQSRLFTVDIETGVLRVLFNEAASWGLMRNLFLKLDTQMNLSSCSVVHWGLPLLFLFWLEPVCAVLWRE